MATPQSTLQSSPPPPPTATMRPGEYAAQAKGQPMLDIPNKQAEAKEKPMLAFVTNRQQAAEAAPGRHEAKPPNYVTDTVTTPTVGRARANTAGPVPLSSWMSSASLNSDKAGFSISRESSITSFSKALTSTTSFRWTPDTALVQCWHRQLSDRYQNYNVESLIGEGRHGAVFCAQHKTSQKVYACKLLHKAEQEISAMRNEIQNLRMLDHPNVVRLYEVNEEADALFLLMEYCSGGDLFSLISDRPEGYLLEPEARGFAHQMLSALSYCHSMDIVHRDVKPENFLLSDNDPATRTLKLADFGIATDMKCIEGQKEGQVHGSIPYMAPELFTRRWSSLVQEFDGNRSFLAASDLWSCGVVIYVMLSGDLPYGDDHYRIADGETPDFSKEVWQGISRDAIELILKLMEPDIAARWTARDALQYEWCAAKNDHSASSASGRNALTITASRFGEGNSFPRSGRDLARITIRCLRRWKQQKWLRRMVIATIAKRMEADNPARMFAESAYQIYKGSHDKLENVALVEGINAALLDTSGPDTLTSPGSESQQSFQAEGRTCKSSSSLGSSISFSPSGSRSVTGLHIRQRVKKAMGLGRLVEDTPMAGSPYSRDLGIMTPGPSEDWASLSELRYLVSSLDGSKDGTIDYTLFVASLIPSEVYCEEDRITEAFSQIDFHGKGQIWPEDLQKLLSKSMKKKDADLNMFKDMVREFDVNSDGCLDLSEFRKMLRGDEQWDHSASTSATPLTTPASRASF
eukprot:TRINITY_DN61990_c0_g1_i1.p1 TRINITY_DN61990_c0_g1~~TRINITY_DN61990_c0_g1_i1.p1  ORF type:complete len:833 (+),score=128.74 TRINITY_DN61990_c0_g1_i1:254-2500(+)